ncbi:polyketide synthase [Stenotrophomonas panacihumi]|uniref:Polyketide synthase n=1 Tax=Stenotrophomonas panacihumi TaxID=676599 RepID=A0A0R0B0R4_9GAMM|nr:DsbA family oxidoreductase [Stenotrophomonas panacihumi]KRG46760.1 polyketide synthase [Stenotrophomonas panacihumi]PTN54623.1 DsbA family oxidoreductase [Stenotrophomonas panacihumi]
MRIDIWSDVVCPWCWIGKHRFQRGVALMGADAPDVDIHYHAFQLDPDAGPDPVPLREAYRAKFGGDARTEQILSQTQQTGRAEGLPFDFDRGQVRANTLQAHRLMWLAAREGDAEAAAEALFRAHFAEGRNLADPDTLVAAGTQAGLDEARIRAFLASDEGLAEVGEQLAQARQLGITAVPSFVIDGRYLIQGAQPPEAIADILGRIAAEQAAPAASQGEGCGPDGCEV